MLRFRFAKAAPKPKKPQQSDENKKILDKLNSYLEQEEPETVEFLFHDLREMGNTVTYKELREAFLAGVLTQEIFEKWQHRYSGIVDSVLRGKWEKAAETAAREIRERFPYFFYEPGMSAAAVWIREHGAELVTNLARDQMDALNAMVGYFAGYAGITPDEAALMIRPCIGLTKPQAIANLRYQNTIRRTYLEQHPKAKQETLDKKASEAGARYAARQHRYRAQCIARTELAFGYNAAAYGATKDAQARGYIGECRKKWVTAYDERVCPICSGMDGETVDMDKPFSNGKILPPGHPHCRCAVAYEEVESGGLTGGGSGDIINADLKRSSGIGTESSEEHWFEKLGKIDPNDDSAVMREINKFMVDNADSKIERCLVIAENGEIYQVHGGEFTVDTEMLGEIMKDSINIHNHVTGKSQYSFSYEDLQSSAADNSKLVMAYDEKYVYSMIMNGFIENMTVHEAYRKAYDQIQERLFKNEIISDEDIQHEIIRIACKILGIKYWRNRR